ncbi:RES family NAD+ phosphorylase [Desulfobacter sp.]|uniref:RES family NAD+ phosphorylase n=1 Tax=Desulfobacter sp. TaxID=2294 RepID=UPI003D113E5B
MEIISYRIVKEKHAHSAFNGEGARLYGGRWNSQGVAVVYTSDSLALCCLEVFVNLPSYEFFKGFVYFKLFFDEKFVQGADLQDGWNGRPISKVSQEIGDNWIRERNSAVLRVPSVIIPEGNNYLINFNYQDSNQIKIGDPISLDFDPRLKK